MKQRHANGSFLRLPTREEYETISLGKDEYVAVLPVNHPPVQKDVLTPDELDGWLFMLLEHGGNTELFRIVFLRNRSGDKNEAALVPLLLSDLFDIWNTTTK